MRKVGAVILAAGAGLRLGGTAKALLRTASNATFLETIVATARTVGLDSGIVVVAAPFGVEIAAHATELGLQVVDNPQPERGMASSIALGFAALQSSGCDGAWLWPVDHPDVAAATLEALIAALGTADAARPTVAGRGGHPPLVARTLFAKLASCGDLANGARDVLAAATVIDLAVNDPGCVRDVDTAIDLPPLPEAP